MKKTKVTLRNGVCKASDAFLQHECRFKCEICDEFVKDELDSFNAFSSFVKTVLFVGSLLLIFYFGIKWMQ